MPSPKSRKPQVQVAPVQSKDALLPGALLPDAPTPTAQALSTETSVTLTSKVTSGDCATTSGLDRELKLWWRFVESEPSVDQEFFFQLPHRRDSTLVRTESGGYRFSPSHSTKKDGLLVQGTAFVSAGLLAPLICSWVRERPTLIVLLSPDGETLEFCGNIDESPGGLEDRIRDLHQLDEGPLRITAMDLGVGSDVPQVGSGISNEEENPLEGMVLTSE